MKISHLAPLIVSLPLLTCSLRAQTAVLQPQNNARDVCPDTQLTLTFPTAPNYGNSGQVRVYDAATDQLVDTIDASVPVAAQNYTLGGERGFHLYPILINGQTATIYLHGHQLDYHKSYYVQMDAGVLQIDGQPFTGFSGKSDWVFTTKSAPPARESTWLVVAADGTGDFSTIQGAVDFVPETPTQPVTIFILRGLYAEVVYFDHKSNLTFLGEDRAGTVVDYPNNESLNHQPNTNEQPATNAYHRGAFFANHSTGLNFLNLTFKNSTPKGGSQAEALILCGGKNIISHCSFYSYQDTLQINDSAYVTDSSIEGDTDFLWGRGPAFFSHCELKTLTSNAPFMQIRNPAENHGFVYDHCTFNGVFGVTGAPLARINPALYPHSEVVLLDCILGAPISPAAWRLDVSSAAPTVHFWEFHSTNLGDHQPADISQRAPFSRQLTVEHDADTITNYRNPAFVLGWTPGVPPTAP